MALIIANSPLTESFALPWQHDPALNHDREDFAAAYQRAVETLDFGPITRAGHTLTLFRFRAVGGRYLRPFMDLDVGGAVRSALAFRLLLIGIEGLDDPRVPKVERVVEPQYPQLGPIASAEIVDFLDALPVSLGKPFGSLIAELGGLAFNRAAGLSGK